MSKTELNSKVKELRELRRMADEIAAEIEAIIDNIKQEMAAQDVDTLAGDDWKATWKPVILPVLTLRRLRLLCPTFTTASPARPKPAVLCWHEKSPLPTPTKAR